MLDTRDGTFGLCATPYAYWKFAKSVSRGQLGLSTGSTGTWLGDGYLPGVSFAATVHVNGYTYVVAANVAKRIADANGQTLRDTVVDMNPIIDRLAEMSNVPSPLEALRPIWDDAQLATLKTYEVMGVDGIKRYFATSKLSEQIDVEALPAVFTKVEQFTAYTKQFGLGDVAL